jgi:hypothetical protein
MVVGRYIAAMTSRTFRISTIRSASKTAKTADASEVAARYFVYKLYEATDGQPNQWKELRDLGETPNTVARAVERGWVILDSAGSGRQGRSAALTNEGRRLARKGR